MSHAPVRREYDRRSASYDRRWRHYVEPSTQATLQFLQITDDQNILDLGCGTGALLEKLVERSSSARVIGLDLSSKMLEVARNRLQGKATLIRGDVSHLPFHRNRFGWIVSASSFHFWRQPGEVLTQIAQILEPEGGLVITDWCDDFVACRLCDRVLRLVSKAHHRTYSSTEFTRLLEANGFVVEQIETYKINWLWGLMTVRAKRSAGGATPHRCARQ